MFTLSFFRKEQFSTSSSASRAIVHPCSVVAFMLNESTLYKEKAEHHLIIKMFLDNDEKNTYQIGQVFPLPYKYYTDNGFNQNFIAKLRNDREKHILIHEIELMFGHDAEKLLVKNLFPEVNNRERYDSVSDRTVSCDDYSDEQIIEPDNDIRDFKMGKK